MQEVIYLLKQVSI